MSDTNQPYLQRTELRTLRTEDGKVETVRVHPLVPRWPEEYVDGQYSVSNEVRIKVNMVGSCVTSESVRVGLYFRLNWMKNTHIFHFSISFLFAFLSKNGVLF